jgi:N-acetylglucosamine-6-phosphate deacetylase
MTDQRVAYLADTILDGGRRHAQAALLVEGSDLRGIVARDAVPEGIRRTDLGAGVIAPGFVDLQVNGGGGVMLNDAPTVDTLRRMTEAHAGLGSTRILPTLITDTPAQTRAAVDAVARAVAAGMPGIAGLHLEGPHLAPARKGAHDAGLIRPMADADLGALCAAAARLPALMVTLAPEAARPDQIAALVRAGAIVSLGHTDAPFDTCRAAFDAGATCVTHLYNAMRQIAGREPGVVGAALADGRVSAGVIADGHHVHAANLGLAVRGKAGPGEVFLVSDAMAVAGTALTEFTLNGREVRRAGGRLTLQDGTLAGADLDLAQAVRVMVRAAGVPLADAVAMATSVPARVIGQGGRYGALSEGSAADFVHLRPDLTLKAVWRGGQRIVPPGAF